MARTPVIPPTQASSYDSWHFAPGFSAGGFLFVSGATGVDAEGEVSSDETRQFIQAFENFGEVLEEAGATFADLVEITTYHVGLQNHLKAFCDVKDRYVNAPFPAWSAIGVQELATPGNVIEIRGIAWTGEE